LLIAAGAVGHRPSYDLREFLSLLANVVELFQDCVELLGGKFRQGNDENTSMRNSAKLGRGD